MHIPSFCFLVCPELQSNNQPVPQIEEPYNFNSSNSPFQNHVQDLQEDEASNKFGFIMVPFTSIAASKDR